MNISQHGETEREEGLGGRVRRFIDGELNRARDKRDRETDESHTEHGAVHDPTANPAQDQEAVNPSVEESKVAVVHPAATAPDETGYGAAGPDPRGESAQVESAVPAHGGTSTEAAADTSATRVGLLNNPAELREQWQQVQGTFVDDPQRAVHEASVLVERTLQEIHENVSRGQISDPTSTEDLRVSFQRYREFFQRLLSA